MSLPLLALFYGRLGDSRLAEFEATSAREGGLQGGWNGQVFRTNGGDEGPSVVQLLSGFGEDDHLWLAKAAARAVSCRGAFEVWGAGDTVEDCATDTEKVPVHWLRRRVDGPWRVEFAVLGARHSAHGRDHGVRMRHFGHVLDALADRPVQLRGPAHKVWLVEDRRWSEGGGPIPVPSPRFLLLFELPSPGQSIQHSLSALDLRKRAFLGTSTLAADRALLLCNLALATARSERPSLADPFCGSGSILLAAAALGAATVGSDIDWRLVSENRVPIDIPATADRPERGVEAVRMTDNFDEAGLPWPRALFPLDVYAPDAAERLLEANAGNRYDALVTDPPYGRREYQHGQAAWDGRQGARVGVEAQARTLRRLLELAVAVVRPRGRLVCLAPVQSPRDSSKPATDALRVWLSEEGGRRNLRLVHLAEERVHGGLHRATVVMERE